VGTWTRPSGSDPRHAAEAGCRVWLVGDFAASRNGNFSVAEDLARRLAAHGLRIATTSDRPSRALRALDMAAATWRRRKGIDVAVVDVYSGRGFLWAEAVCAILRRAGVPYALVLRGGGLPSFGRRQSARVGRLLRSAAAVVALSRYLAEGMSEHGGTFHVLPNPIDLSAYAYRPRTAAEPKLVWLRTFHATYNPTLAVRVLAMLRDEFPTVRLTMVGPDKGDGTLEAVRRAAQQLGVQERIEYTGPVPKAEVPAQLQRGDVFLNTPRIDNVPISLLEAMACGLCVVSTDVGGIPYLVEDGRDALLVGADDAEAMAAATARCLREPRVAAGLSEAGRRLAEKHDWGSVLPLWVDLLEGLASGGRR
jgi:glycosyltransferase involved in cell wall biosynthesis